MTDEHEVIEISDDDDEPVFEDEVEEEAPMPKRRKVEKTRPPPPPNYITQIAPSFRELVDRIMAPRVVATDGYEDFYAWNIAKVFADTESLEFEPDLDDRLKTIRKYLLARFEDVLDDKGKVARPKKFARMISVLFPKEQYMKLLYLLVTGNLQTGKVLRPSDFRFASEEEVIKRLTAKDSQENKILGYLNEKGGIDSTLRASLIYNILRNVIGEEDKIVKTDVYDIWLTLAKIFNYGVDGLFRSGLGTSSSELARIKEQNKKKLEAAFIRLAEQGLTKKTSDEAAEFMNALKQQENDEEKRAMGFYELLSSENEGLGKLNGFLVKDGLLSSARSRKLDRETLSPKALFADLYKDFSFKEKGMQDSYPREEDKLEVLDNEQPSGVHFKGDLRRLNAMARPFANLEVERLNQILAYIPKSAGYKIHHDWLPFMHDLRGLNKRQLYDKLFPKKRGYSFDALADLWQIPLEGFHYRGNLFEEAIAPDTICKAEFSKNGAVKPGKTGSYDLNALWGDNYNGDYLKMAVSFNVSPNIVLKFLVLILELITDPYRLMMFGSDGHSFSLEQFDKIQKTWVGIWDDPYYLRRKELEPGKVPDPGKYFDNIDRFIAFVLVDTSVITGEKKSSLHFKKNHALAVMILINENKVLVYDSSDFINTPEKLHITLMLTNPGFYRYIIKRMQKAGFKKPTIAVWRKSEPLVKADMQDYSLVDSSYPREVEDYIANHTIFRTTQTNPEGSCALQATYTCFFLALNPSFYAPPFINFSSLTRDVLYPMRHDKRRKHEPASPAIDQYLVRHSLRYDDRGLLTVDQFARYIICCLMAGHILNFEEYIHTGAGIIKSKKSLPRTKKIR